MSALGEKHECVQCETKFYDLGKTPVICPSCGRDQAADTEAQQSDEQE